MTPEERRRLVPQGCYVKTKCDRCGRAIMTCLTYTGPNGEDFCSKACLNRREDPKKVEKKMSETKKAAKEAPEKAKEAPEKKKPAPSKNKSAAPEKTKSAKKKAVEDDEDEAPAKKSKKTTEEVERNPKNPYARPNAIVYQVFELALAGTTVKAINKKIAEVGVNPNRVWRELKSGEFKGVRWRYSESEDGKVIVKIRSKKSEE